MATINDDTIVKKILLMEGINGEYTNHPDDAGGPTRWGITIPVLEAYVGHSCTADDIRNLDRETAERIYILKFIRPFDGVNDTVRVNALDMGVNAGVYRGIVLLQQTMRADVDGKIGPQTRRLSSGRNWNALYTGARLLFYEQLIVSRPANMTWRNGWHNRALSYVDRTLLTRARLRRRGPVFGFTGKAYLIEPA